MKCRNAEHFFRRSYFLLYPIFYLSLSLSLFHRVTCRESIWTHFFTFLSSIFTVWLNAHCIHSLSLFFSLSYNVSCHKSILSFYYLTITQLYFSDNELFTNSPTKIKKKELYSRVRAGQAYREDADFVIYSPSRTFSSLQHNRPHIDSRNWWSQIENVNVAFCAPRKMIVKREGRTISQW